MIGVIDLLTGYELSFSILYVVPVLISSWYGGRRLGFGVCILSAATWLAVDYTAGHQYTHPAIPFWNASVRLAFFSIISDLLGRLRGALAIQVSLAEQDSLTGIMNARTFRQRGDSLVHLAARYGHAMALGYLDVDGFKGVNDSLGHSGGDRVLKAVATAIAQRLRRSDFVGRMGGDEFAILLSETDLAGARAFFTEMSDALQTLAAHNHWPIGFSIGVAVFRSPPPNLEDALRYADDLMYKIKSTGKNNILFEERPSEERT